MRYPANVSGSNMIFPNDTYLLECLDQAEEIKARIRFMIREWNQDPITEGGDPDVTGSDPNFPGNPINDRMDWLDFGLTYPASLI
jgi:hypothetical protein